MLILVHGLNLTCGFDVTHICEFQPFWIKASLMIKMGKLVATRSLRSASRVDAISLPPPLCPIWDMHPFSLFSLRGTGPLAILSPRATGPFSVGFGPRGHDPGSGLRGVWQQDVAATQQRYNVVCHWKCLSHWRVRAIYHQWKRSQTCLISVQVCCCHWGQ